MSGELVVNAEGIHFRRANRNILVDVSFAVQRGESLALVGPSGSGKSALLALIARLDQPDTGRLDVAVPRAKVGLVLQGYGLIGLMTVAENIAMPLLTPAQPTIPAEEVHTRVAEVLGIVGLHGFADTLVEVLSGGQQQRVAIARALVIRPVLLLADEPSAALDPDTRDQVMYAIHELHRAGTTVVTATHDLAIAATLQRRIELADGRAVS